MIKETFQSGSAQAQGTVGLGSLHSPAQAIYSLACFFPYTACFQGPLGIWTPLPYFISVYISFVFYPFLKDHLIYLQTEVKTRNLSPLLVLVQRLRPHF